MRQKIQLFGDDWNLKRVNAYGHDYLSVSYENYLSFCNLSASFGLVPIASPLDETRLSWVLEQNDSIIKIGYGVFRDRVTFPTKLSNRVIELLYLWILK